jgi:hypothetical protein
MTFDVVIGSLREPTDLAGLPFVRKDETVALAPPAWAVDACNSGESGHVVLLDELTTATPAVQAAMLRIIQEGVVGDLKLPERVRIVAAYNDADDCGGYELVLPMRSRLLHIEVTADAHSFADALLRGWPQVRPAEFAASEVDRDELRARWAVHVAAFLKSRPDLVEAPPAIGSWGGYPTPRTWELTIDALTVAEIDGVLSSVRDLLVEGCLGPGAAHEFLQFVRNLDLPDPAYLLDHPEEVVPYLQQDRPDRAYAVLIGVARLTVASQVPTRWTNSWKIGALAIDAGFGDVLNWCFADVAARRPGNAETPAEFQRVVEFLSRG